jgi:hypothetical protein
MNTNSRKMSLDEMTKGLPASQREELRKHEAAQIAKRGGEQYFANLKPESHRDIFRVRVTPRFGSGQTVSGAHGGRETETLEEDRYEESNETTGAREDDRQERGWAWALHAETTHAMVMTELHYGSPTLRFAQRTPEGDFWPRDDVGAVAPAGPSTDDTSEGGCMFGRRVEVFGLQATPELNGRRGRVGAWDPARGRYTVSLNHGERVVAIKPERLRLLPPVPITEVSSLPKREGGMRSSPPPEVQGQPKVSLCTMIQPGENMGENLEGGS